MHIIEDDILLMTTGTIAHQVNCKGVMGKGLALKIANKWPNVFQLYRDFVLHNQASGTEMLAFVQYCQVEPYLYVANCFAQKGYGCGLQTSYEALALCFEQLSNSVNQRPIYIPYGMGCGLGGGDWNKVSQLFEVFCPEAILVRKTK